MNLSFHFCVYSWVLERWILGFTHGLFAMFGTCAFELVEQLVLDRATVLTVLWGFLMNQQGVPGLPTFVHCRGTNVKETKLSLEGSRQTPGNNWE